MRLLWAFLLVLLTAQPGEAVEAFWLDQYNALLYLATFRLDAELKAMGAQRSQTLLLHADALPSPIIRFIAWRARNAAGMDTVAWIQKPSRANLSRAAGLAGIKAVQIDDHFFNKPPLPIGELKQQLGSKGLWCSFQPRQFNLTIASQCAQSDVQIYRQTCSDTVAMAWRLGILGQPNIAIATYADGSKQGDEQVQCVQDELQPYGNPLFVFKWDNQEVWSKQIWRVLKPTKKA